MASDHSHATPNHYASPHAGATKGILFARVAIGSQCLDIFNCHLQASHGGNMHTYSAVRHQQLQELRTFIIAKNQRSGHPWALTGDFNIDAISESTDPTGKYGISLRPPEHESDAYRHLVETVHPR